MQVDLADDRFDITYDPGRTSPAVLLAAIRELGYEPVVVPRQGASTRAVDRVAVASLPEDVAALFARARKAGKKVLLHFSGPG